MPDKIVRPGHAGIGTRNDPVRVAGVWKGGLARVGDARFEGVLVEIRDPREDADGQG